jgi:hypothetical protein
MNDECLTVLGHQRLDAGYLVYPKAFQLPARPNDARRTDLCGCDVTAQTPAIVMVARLKILKPSMAYAEPAFAGIDAVEIDETLQRGFQLAGVVMAGRSDMSMRMKERSRPAWLKKAGGAGEQTHTGAHLVTGQAAAAIWTAVLSA